MQNVIVTGGNGFVGKYLVEHLLARGCFVYNISHMKTTRFQNNERYSEIICPLDDLDNIVPLIDKNVDTIFHLAWSGTSGELRADSGVQITNIENTCHIVELAKRKNIKRILYAGSIMEYDCLNNLLADGVLLNKSSLYGVAKLSGHFMGALLSKAYSIDFIPLIISHIYGTGEESPRFLNSMIRQMKKDDKILLTDATQLYDFIYMTDAVEMILLIAESGTAFKSYYIGNQQQYPLKQYVLQLKEIMGYSGELVFGAIPFEAKKLTYREFDTNSFYEDFSYRPQISFAEGIRKIWGDENT